MSDPVRGSSVDAPRFDVFVSYAHADADWVRILAGRLHQAGLQVFLDEWQITPGDVLVHSLDDAILASTAGILVVSPQSMGSSWVREEYAALLGQAVDQGRRLIPVIYQDAEVPPLLATRVWVDFRHADGPAYDTALTRLIGAIRGQPPGRPPTDRDLLVAPGSAFRPAGPRRARLTVTNGQVELIDLDRDTTVTVRPEPDRNLIYRLRDLDHARQARRGWVTRRDELDSAATDIPVQRSLHEVGALLGRVYTPGAAGQALSALTSDARGQHVSLQLEVDAEGDLEDLPWEALIPPDGPRPLALDPTIQLFRSVTVDGPTPALSIPAPLRVLAVLAAPFGRDSGPVLDTEHELATILDAVEPARKQARAYVRVLNTGTLDAIREALTVQRFHVLHISSHAGPDSLLLEKPDGSPHPVTAPDLIKAIPNDKAPALIVLAGCSTAQNNRNSDDPTRALPGLARKLIAAGIPQVLAMTAPVTDRYATRFGAQFYRELALSPTPSVIAATAVARQQVEDARQALPAEHLEAHLVEWATPTVLLRGRPLPLYDPTAGLEQITEPTSPTLAAGIPLRPLGDFVGRRSDLHTLTVAMRKPGRAGVLVHGIGGVGKSSLTAELFRALNDDIGLVVSVVGATTADQLLDAFGRTLFTQALATGQTDSHPDRQLATFLRTPSEPWQDRLSTALALLAERPVTLLLDNFETNLEPQPDGTGRIVDETLAELLAQWIRTPGVHRTVITSRYPFTLPAEAHKRLTVHHLGPLSLAETRKLIWRLPTLDALTAVQQQQAWTVVGGHPRTMEYLDALLRQGQARFPDVTERLERLLDAEGISPEGWTAEPGSEPSPEGVPSFDRALAEAVTVTVNDTLLHDLVGLLDPAARALLIGAAVYRNPADQLALAWQTAQSDPIPDDPDRDQRLHRLGQDLTAAAREGRPTGLDEQGYTTEHLAQLQADLAAMRRPPLTATVVDPAVLAVLGGLGLITPTPADSPSDPRPGPDGGLFSVHRWTATALARLYPEPTRQAHQRAAAYYTWRIQYRPQGLVEDLYDRIEARYHHHTAGDLPAAISLSYDIRDQLDGWSAWDWEKRICQETLTWLPATSYDTAAFTHQLGNLAYLTGDLAEAERRYQQSLTIVEELGDRAGTALSYHQLGMLAQDRGDYVEAERRHQQALTIKEDLGDRAGAARSYHELGNLAYLTGDLAEAERRYQQSLTIKEDLGDRAGTALSYHQLGMLAQNRGDYAEAKRRYQQSLTILEDLGDRAGTARSYHQLGNLAYLTGDLAEAERR
ncbi:tetratricopeptide repeat protein, partial [Actinoplanes bogorensis]